MKATTIVHRVAFHETDAMGIVHHSNYVRYLEVARVHWLDEHDRPYRDYVEAGHHFATTRLDLRYHRAAAFDELLNVQTWLEWVRGVSLAMAYEVTRGGDRILSGSSEHALVDLGGRLSRIPPERRSALRALARTEGPGVRRRTDREDRGGSGSSGGSAPATSILLPRAQNEAGQHRPSRDQVVFRSARSA